MNFGNRTIQNEAYNHQGKKIMNRCLEDGCSNRAVRRGYCDRHYREALRTGKLEYKWPKYNYYGGRGIKVCDRWMGKNGFWKFIEDMGECPSGYSLDRVDNNSDYCPNNCRWADAKTQANNKRNNMKIDGKTVKEVSLETGINEDTLRYRIRHKWPRDNLLDPVRRSQL